MHTFKMERYGEHRPSLRLVYVEQGNPGREWTVVEGIPDTVEGRGRIATYAEVFLAGMDVAKPTSRTFSLEMV